MRGNFTSFSEKNLRTYFGPQFRMLKTIPWKKLAGTLATTAGVVPIGGLVPRFFIGPMAFALGRYNVPWEIANADALFIHRVMKKQKSGEQDRYRSGKIKSIILASKETYSQMRLSKKDIETFVRAKQRKKEERRKKKKK